MFEYFIIESLNMFDRILCIYSVHRREDSWLKESRRVGETLWFFFLFLFS